MSFIRLPKLLTRSLVVLACLSCRAYAASGEQNLLPALILEADDATGTTWKDYDADAAEMTDDEFRRRQAAEHVGALRQRFKDNALTILRLHEQYKRDQDLYEKNDLPLQWAELIERNYAIEEELHALAMERIELEPEGSPLYRNVKAGRSVLSVEELTERSNAAHMNMTVEQFRHKYGAPRGARSSSPVPPTGLETPQKPVAIVPESRKKDLLREIAEDLEDENFDVTRLEADDDEPELSPEDMRLAGLL